MYINILLSINFYILSRCATTCATYCTTAEPSLKSYSRNGLALIVCSLVPPLLHRLVTTYSLLLQGFSSFLFQRSA
nr:MAG TPA: hypothetical protein [Caudoviricetes sp.]